MVRFSCYNIIIFVVSIIVCNTFDYVSGGLFTKSPEKKALEDKLLAQQTRCIEDLQKHFGESCIKSNDAKTCANRAMIAINYEEHFSNVSESFAKKYFELLMDDLLPNNKLDTNDCCHQRFLKIEKDINYILGLLEMSDIQITSGIPQQKFRSKLYDGVVVEAKTKCTNSLIDFYRVANDTSKANNIQAILKHVFKNKTMINLTNTIRFFGSLHVTNIDYLSSLTVLDELDYFINYIFKKFKVGGKAPKPKQFCKHPNPLQYTIPKKLTNKV